MLTRNQIRSLVNEHGHDIIVHDHMQHIERGCYQHGAVTTFAHSIRVACLAVWMADRLHLWDKVDLHSLVRAALLHDYFLYDWHDWDDGAPIGCTGSRTGRLHCATQCVTSASTRSNVTASHATCSP